MTPTQKKAQEIRSKIIAHAAATGLKIPSIGTEKYPNPFPVCGRTIKSIYYNKRVSSGTLARLELWFQNLEQEQEKIDLLLYLIAENKEFFKSATVKHDIAFYETRISKYEAELKEIRTNA